MYDQDEYQLNYQNLTFENKLRIYRMKYIVDYFGGIKSNKILEIGCGHDPIFLCYDDFTTMDIVEPGNHFYEFTKKKIGNDTRITIYNKLIEEAYLELKNDYDVIVLGGFLHEIDNPEEVLSIIKKIATPQTVILTYVPNANSFHRILAFESGIIKSIYDFSENDKLFGRRNVYNVNSFLSLFVTSGYSVSKVDTYFIKPFTHEQMDALLGLPFFTEEIFLGFFNMAKYLPDMGCEIFLAASLPT